MAGGDYAAAIRAYGQALIQRPGSAETHFQLGRAWHQSDQHDKAISAYSQAIALRPSMAAAYRNMGLAYYQTGRLPHAAACYEQALKLEPDTADLLISLGSIYGQMKAYDKAETCFWHAMRIDPDDLSARYNLGNLYLEQGQLAAAVKAYQQVLDRDPFHTKALCNMGRAQHRLGNLEDARSYFEHGLTIDAHHPELRFNRAITLLLSGQWRAGWPDYECRFKCHNRQRIYPHQLNGQRWQGEIFRGKTLLIHAEQGLGDAIQYVRFLPQVKTRGGNVVLETHPALMRLFQSLKGVDGLIALSAQQAPQEPYDLYVPLCSLSGIFGVAPTDPPPSSPYLFAESQKTALWRSRLPSEGINIGIVWAGSDTYPERTCSLQAFSEIGNVPGITWIGLQKGPAAVQAQQPQCPPGFNVINWGLEFADFSDTAAAIASLDLVISIDTSVAHLAGALGKPVWLLLPQVPDWRWMMNTTRTPWYAQMHLFRQSRQGDWRSVMLQVKEKLRQLCNNHLSSWAQRNI